ncbi:probable basic-leucine zipper transcription factor S [Gordionus sp. m RMFG-2023]|uniref:probable basic-leucine zipper transcription factor S n=1 Tax=Gordionus sp. m RMFG-2023 TaxID=3053472 RepID=UPI0031FCC32C
MTFNKNDDKNQNFNDELDTISNNLPPTSENQNFNDELDTISNNLPPTSENQNFNDELDTISNNLPLTSEIPRYSIKNYDKNKLNTLDHFKSLPSISSIILKKNDSSQQNIIGCINLEFKGISQLIFTPRGKKNSDNKQKNTLSHNKSLSNKYISKKSRENLNGNEVPLMSAIPTYSRNLRVNRQPIILDHLEPSPTTNKHGRRPGKGPKARKRRPQAFICGPPLRKIPSYATASPTHWR